MNKVIAAMTLLFAAVSAAGQSSQADIRTFIGHPPVFEFYKELRRAIHDCESAALTYWRQVDLPGYQGGNAEAQHLELGVCIAKKNDAVRGSLSNAIRYLGDRGGSVKAIKDAYLAWSAYMVSLRPEAGERFESNKVKTSKAQKATDEALRAFALELSLGT